MNKTETVVVVQRRFKATAERVFDAWLNPQSAGQWLFKTPMGKMTKVEIDAKVGGSWKIVEQRGEVEAEHRGKYLEIDRPKKLVFTFGGPGFPDTKVTIDIKALTGNSCELILTHEGVWAEYKDKTNQGWSGVLDGLAKNVE